MALLCIEGWHFYGVFADDCDMPFVPILPNFDLSTPTLQASTMTLKYESPMAASSEKFQGVSPLGQPTFGFRLGYAQSDTSSYFGGIDFTQPITPGIHVVSVRFDGDIWRNTTSDSRGGTDVAANAIFGPKASYYGAGIAYAARYGGASGPAGVGLKLIYGSQILIFMGYEVDLITTSKGTAGAVMLAFHTN